MSNGIASWFGGRRKSRMPDLGARELAVLESLWACETASAQDIRCRLPGKPIALSTVQSTLERLYRKKLVVREKQGRAYCYTATLRRSQLISLLLRDIAEEIAGGEMAPMMSGFAEFVAAESPDFDIELDRLLQRKGSDDA